MAVSTANYGTGVIGANVAVNDADATPIDVLNVGASSTLTYETPPGTGCPTPKCCKHHTVAGNAYWQWTTHFGSLTDFYGRMYLYFPTLPANAVHILIGRNTGVNAWLMRVDTTGKVQLQNSAATTVISSTTSIVAGQWARIEWHIVNSATVGSLQCRIYLTPSSTGTPDQDFNMTAQNTNTLTNQMGVGDGSGGTNDFYTAGVLIGDTAWPGPLSTGLTLTADSTGQTLATAGGGSVVAQIQPSSNTLRIAIG